MCRTRQEIISDEPEIQKLIELKNDISDGRINGFDDGRKYYEITKLEAQINSTIREFMVSDTQSDQAKDLKRIEEGVMAGF